MFTWAEIALLVLRIANLIMEQVASNKAFQAGTDAEIAKVSAAILAKTKAGKAIMEKVNAMSEADVDAGLIALEPKSK
jgi:hypothetical protein